MALANKCDRCGKLYEYYPIGNQSGVFNAVRRIRKDDYGSIACKEQSIDLCPECMGMLKKFLKGKNI